jgi:uncharacterized membrane protein
MRRIARLGEWLFATLMLYSGVMHFKFAQFVANIVPSWLPWHLFWAYFTGAMLFAGGISIVIHKLTRVTGTLLGILLSSFLLFIHAPSMIHSVISAPHDARVLWSFNGTGGVNNALKDLALTLSALMLAVFERESRYRRSAGWMLTSTFAIVMVLFGVEHFFFTQFTPGIPSWSFVNFWIPLRMVCGYVTGAGLIVGGAMILLQRKVTLSATCLGLMIVVVAALTYAFRMVARLGSYGELTNSIKDLAVGGGALIIAGSMQAKDPLVSRTEVAGGSLQTT